MNIMKNIAGEMKKDGLTIPVVYLSPTKNAAREMANNLPDPWTMLGETRRIFHFGTNEYSEMRRTIQLACVNKGVSEPEIVSVETFCDWVKGKKQGDFCFENLEKEKSISKDGFIFVDITREGDFSEKNNTLNTKLILKYFLYCDKKQQEQSLGTGESFYQVFFIHYGDKCNCSEMLGNKICKIDYKSLTSEDFGILLQEFHMRNQLEMQEQHRRRNLRVPSVTTLDITKLQKTLEWYENHMSGMSETEVRCLLIGVRNKFQLNDVDYTKTERIEEYIIEYKNRILQQHGRLELVNEKEDSLVCGIEQVDTWIKEHKEAMHLPKDAPTGILLVGIPGTGKSAIAKMTAREFQLPLVKLEMSRILGGRVGDSEKGMRTMLEDLKFAAPCVLWIDEIEKAMSGADGKSGDSGVIQRLFGMLLTFIQENKKPVFTVTTANDISNLPPEFFRNGRFDQTFCVMMPDYRGCCDIMKSKLESYSKKLGWNRKFKEDEIEEIFNVCVGTKISPKFLTGADITAHVRELFWKYHKSGETCPSDVKEIVKRMEEIANTMRTQALAESPSTMIDIAKRYLDMMQRGMRMAGSKESPFVMKNMNLDVVRYYEYSEEKAEMGLPSCLKEYEGYKGMEKCDNPKEWYDAVFYKKLAKAMGEVIIFDQEMTLDDTRTEYLKLMRRINRINEKSNE